MEIRAKPHGMNQRALSRTLRWLGGLPRPAKTVTLIIFDLLILTVVSFSAYFIRFGALLTPSARQISLLLLVPPITCGCLYALRAYGNVSRLHASSIEGALAVAIAGSALLWSSLILVLGVEGFPRSLVFLYGGLSIIVYITLRRFVAWLFWLAHVRWPGDAEIKNVAIFGVNQFGSNLVQNLRASSSSRPVAFIDSDPANIGRRVAGLPVVAMSDLSTMVDDKSVDTIVLALTQRSRHSRSELIHQLTHLNVRIETIAPPEDILSGRVSISDTRPINVEDVLGRDPIAPQRNLLERAVSGRRVMVTGAGGSIGSELVRQSICFAPTILVLFELSEAALYEIQREAEATAAALGAQIQIIPVLGSVCDLDLVRRTMNAWAPEVVLHAAAYKHVPLGESNACSCVYNNVVGARVLADCSIETNVKLFLLVSTDKAVRPTNVMGASKRIAELILQDRAARQSKTTFTMVRFGNVLASSGSVIPLFREQIANGGPVTVTDPRMVRYFMTIPEAVELVLQAAGMARGGDVFVLDMGEPVKIDSLARTLISLSGRSVRDADNPTGDIEIVYSGIRPGEKLFEELLIGENVIATEHPRIMRCLEEHLSSEAVERAIAKIELVVQTGDETALRECISATVEGYCPVTPRAASVRYC